MPNLKIKNIIIIKCFKPEFEVVDPVEVERGDGVDDEGGGDVRLTCNEFEKLAIFLHTKLKPENFYCKTHHQF